MTEFDFSRAQRPPPGVSWTGGQRPDIGGRIKSVRARLKRRVIAILRPIFWPKNEREKTADVLRAHEMLNIEFDSASNVRDPFAMAGGGFGGKPSAPISGTRLLKPRAGFSQDDVVDEALRLAERFGWKTKCYEEHVGWFVSSVKISNVTFDVRCSGSWADPECHHVLIRFEQTLRSSYGTSLRTGRVRPPVPKAPGQPPTVVELDVRGLDADTVAAVILGRPTTHQRESETENLDPKDR